MVEKVEYGLIVNKIKEQRARSAPAACFVC